MSVTLQASFQSLPAAGGGPAGLSLRARVENLGDADILVLDRLWDLGGGKKILDAEHVYRFERDGSLRLLLGPAPLPRRGSALYRNVPMGTRVPARAALDREIFIPAPIKEYSVYFPESDPEAYAAKSVGKVHLLVGYLVAKPDLSTRAAAVDPDAVEIDNPVLAMAGMKLLVASGEVGPFEVQRRTDTFDRVLLPGEAPEPLMLA
jgi:hypothetical protein